MRGEKKCANMEKEHLTFPNECKSEKRRARHLDPRPPSVETDRKENERERANVYSLDATRREKYFPGGRSRAAEVTKLSRRWLNALNRRRKFSLLIIPKGRTRALVPYLRAMVTTKGWANIQRGDKERWLLTPSQLSSLFLSFSLLLSWQSLTWNNKE